MILKSEGNLLNDLLKKRDYIDVDILPSSVDILAIFALNSISTTQLLAFTIMQHLINYLRNF
jgi:hypothetical protein